MEWFLILWAKIQKVSKELKVNVIDNVISHNPFAALSANMGRYLNGRINNLQDGALFLSAWNCITGLPEDDPRELPYDYKKGMFFIVSETAENKKVNAPNYRPSGTHYEPGVPSTEVETEEVNVGDKYWYSGTSWNLIPAKTGDVTWLNIVGDDPYQNDALAGALNEKVTADSTSSTYAKVYAKDKTGAQNNLIVTRDAYANSVVQRDSNNRFAVGEPANGTDAATKNYADKMLNMSGSGTYQGTSKTLRFYFDDGTTEDNTVVVRSN